MNLRHSLGTFFSILLFTLLLALAGCTVISSKGFPASWEQEMRTKAQTYYLKPEERTHWERHIACWLSGVDSPYDTKPTAWPAVPGELFFKRDPKLFPALPSPAEIRAKFSRPFADHSSYEDFQREVYWLKITAKLRAFHLNDLEKLYWTGYYTQLLLDGNRFLAGHLFTMTPTPWPAAAGGLFFTHDPVQELKNWSWDGLHWFCYQKEQESRRTGFYTTTKTDWPAAKDLFYVSDPLVLAQKATQQQEPAMPSRRDAVLEMMWKKFIASKKEKFPNPWGWAYYYHFRARGLPTLFTAIPTPCPVTTDGLYLSRPYRPVQEIIRELENLRWELYRRDQALGIPSIFTETPSRWSATSDGLFYKADPVDLAKLLNTTKAVQFEGEEDTFITFTYVDTGKVTQFVYSGYKR